MEFQLSYLQMMLLKSGPQLCQQIWKAQQWPQDWKRSVFIPIPKKGNTKECSNCCTIALISHSRLPCGSDGKASACNMGDLGLIPGLGRRKWQPTPVPLLGKSHGQRSLVGYTNSWTQLSDFTSHASKVMLKNSPS